MAIRRALSIIAFQLARHVFSRSSGADSRLADVECIFIIRRVPVLFRSRREKASLPFCRRGIFGQHLRGPPSFVQLPHYAGLESRESYSGAYAPKFVKQTPLATRDVASVAVRWCNEESQRRDRYPARRFVLLKTRGENASIAASIPRRWRT
jgi:hypothetical protein